ncbi:hypothetical protein CapIbe_011632 [Capra ibex]
MGPPSIGGNKPAGLSLSDPGDIYHPGGVFLRARLGPTQPAHLHKKNTGPIRPTQEPSQEPLERGLPLAPDPVFWDPEGKLASTLRT